MVRLPIPDSRFPIWPPGQQKITIWVPIPDFLSRQKIPEFSCFLIFVTNQRDWIWSIATMASAIAKIANRDGGTKLQFRIPKLDFDYRYDFSRSRSRSPGFLISFLIPDSGFLIFLRCYWLTKSGIRNWPRNHLVYSPCNLT